VTNHSKGSTERDDGQVVLSEEERWFRQSLFTAASHLDVPSSLLEARISAGFRDHSTTASGSGRWLRLERVVIGTSLGLAAALALLWGLNQQRVRFALGPEPALAPLVVGATSTAARLVVWDGEGNGTNAKGWASKDESDKQTSTVEALAGVGHDRSVGLKWHTEGRNWTGFGWNWHSWYPSLAGTDISGYDKLAFKIRIEANSGANLPETSALTVGLISSGGSGKKVTADAKLSNFVGPELLDGNWHELSIPLAALDITTNAKGFDPRTAWEFRLNHWSTERRNFTLYADDIAFEASGDSPEQ